MRPTRAWSSPRRPPCRRSAEAVDTAERTVVDVPGFRDLVETGRSGGAVEPDAGGEDLAVLLFTSGTSGRPKGAMLSHRALLANLEQCARIEPPPMRPDDVVLLVLPLFHIYGLNAGLGMVARTGATAVLLERFDPRESLELIRRERVTNIPGAPPMYIAWAQLAGGDDPVDVADALREVRLLASGASPLPPAVLEQVRTGAGVAINEGYGLTETAPVVSSTLVSAEAKPGSVGRPIPGVELRLVDEEGEDVQDDDAGEIWVRGDNVFSGYWPDGAGGPDEQGWYATGDVAYADEDGDLFLVGRRKELILVSGFNVYPREIEDAIGEHPDVAGVGGRRSGAPADRGGGQGVRRGAARGGADRRGHQPRTPLSGSPASSSRRSWRWSPSCRTRSPARSPRAGCAMSADARRPRRRHRDQRTRTRRPRITLIGKPGCHLCDEAREVVAAVAAEVGVGWEERSILDDPALQERYAEQIPVTLVDGRPHDFWRVSADRLRAALTA